MRRYLATINDKEFTIDLEYRGGRYQAMVNGKEVEIDLALLGESRSLMVMNNHAWEVDVHGSGYGSEMVAFMRGMEIPVQIEDFALAQLRKTAGVKSGGAVMRLMKAPMPGLVLGVKVKPGDKVTKGQPLLVVEAMKMENIIKAQGDAVVKAIFVEAGKPVEKGDKLMEFA